MTNLWDPSYRLYILIQNIFPNSKFNCKQFYPTQIIHVILKEFLRNVIKISSIQSIVKTTGNLVNFTFFKKDNSNNHIWFIHQQQA